MNGAREVFILTHLVLFSVCSESVGVAKSIILYRLIVCFMLFLWFSVLFPLIWYFTLILSPIYRSETDFEYLSMSKSKEQSRMDNPEKLTKLNTQDEEKQIKIHKTICVGHHYTQANTHNVNKTWDFLQTTGCKDEPNIVFWGNLNVHHNTETTTMRCR